MLQDHYLSTAKAVTEFFRVRQPQQENFVSESVTSLPVAPLSSNPLTIPQSTYIEDNLTEKKELTTEIRRSKNVADFLEADWDSLKIRLKFISGIQSLPFRDCQWHIKHDVTERKGDSYSSFLSPAEASDFVTLFDALCNDVKLGFNIYSGLRLFYDCMAEKSTDCKNLANVKRFPDETSTRKSP